MGNKRFRLSNMMPNAWFYKLKDMSTKTNKLATPITTSTTTSTLQKTYLCNPKFYSYHLSITEPNRPEKTCNNSPKNPKSLNTQFRDPPRKSSTKKSKRKSIYKPSPCQSTNDIIIDMDGESFTRKFEDSDDFGPVKTKEKPKCNPVAARRSSATSTTSVKLRKNTPKIACKKIQGSGRKSISSSNKTYSKSKSSKKFSESFAVVKFSKDPESEFRESMMEMIVENNIRASKDLEELLACYLLLNLNEYHDLIVKAFEQIWFNMIDRHM